MKHTSFKVAKAIKEAGYPQDKSEHDEGYAISEVHYEVYSTRDARWYSSSADTGRVLSFDADYYYPEDCGEYCVAPYYMEVLLWLWRQKDIKIKYDLGFIISGAVQYQSKKWYSDPEEAIAFAIEYLVENNLIK